VYHTVKLKSTFIRIFAMSNHENLISLVETYVAENAKFVEKGNKAAGTRARKALAEIAKAVKERRKEIQESKTAIEGA
jgi:hypothetical protein